MSVNTQKAQIPNKHRGQTGPRTPAGKARSSRNAVKHGLRSRALVLPGEDVQDCESFLTETMASLQPRGRAAEELARQIAETMWMSRRFVGWHGALARIGERNTPEPDRAKMSSIELQIAGIRKQITLLQRDPASEVPLIVRLSLENQEAKVPPREVCDLYFALAEKHDLDEDPKKLEKYCLDLQVPAAAAQEPWRWSGWTIGLTRALVEKTVAEGNQSMDEVIAEAKAEWEAGLQDQRTEARRKRAVLHEEIRKLEQEHQDLLTERIIAEDPRQDLVLRYDAAATRKLERLLKMFETAQKLCRRTE